MFNFDILKSSEKKGILKAIIFVFILFLIGLYLYYLYPSFSYYRSEYKKIEPQIRAAKELNLSYSDVKFKSEIYASKPVIWCIQNLGNGNVFYKGEMDKRVLVSNYNQMPLYLGSKHKNCTDMLLNITKSSSPYHVSVEFIYALELR